jgi:hypothetical protein
MVPQPKVNQNPLAGFMRQPKIYIKLPSGGEFWPAGSLDRTENGEYPVYSMTAKDELMLKVPDALMNGQAVVSVIEHCVPNIKNAWHTPNLDLDVVAAAQKSHLVSIPGIATSSEFFQAYKSGVRIMKLFPFSNLGIPFMKSLQSVSPTDAHLVPVGGVDIENILELVQAGALAVGIGNSLYDPKISKEQFIERCSRVAKAIS